MEKAKAAIDESRRDSFNETNEGKSEQSPSTFSTHQSFLTPLGCFKEIPKKKTRAHNRPKIVHAKKQMKQNHGLMKQVCNHEQPKETDDECSTFGILVAKKLRKLSEERRDIMMVKINQLFVDERKETKLKKSTSTPSYYAEMYSSPMATETIMIEEDVDCMDENPAENKIYIRDESSDSACETEYLISNSIENTNEVDNN